MLETEIDLIRVTVIATDGEIYQIFECTPCDISADWFETMLRDDVHPWRRFHVFVTPGGQYPEILN